MKDNERRGRRRKHRANSEGSIYSDQDGRWRGALTIGWKGDKPKAAAASPKETAVPKEPEKKSKRTTDNTSSGRRSARR